MLSRFMHGAEEWLTSCSPQTSDWNSGDGWHSIARSSDWFVRECSALLCLVMWTVTRELFKSGKSSYTVASILFSQTVRSGQRIVLLSYLAFVSLVSSYLSYPICLF